jgi:uncharacterized membrane protein
MGKVRRALLLVAGAVLGLEVIAVVVGVPSPEAGTFTSWTAVIVAGYFLFPVLGVIAGGLLLISLLLMIGAAIERRRTGADAP